MFEPFERTGSVEVIVAGEVARRSTSIPIEPPTQGDPPRERLFVPMRQISADTITQPVDIGGELSLQTFSRFDA